MESNNQGTGSEKNFFLASKPSDTNERDERIVTDRGIPVSKIDIVAGDKCGPFHSGHGILARVPVVWAEIRSSRPKRKP